MTSVRSGQRIATNEEVSVSRLLNVCSFAASRRHLINITLTSRMRGCTMKRLRELWVEQAGQDIAEYAVMLAVILVLVVGTIRLVGSNANNAFSAVASSIQ